MSLIKEPTTKRDNNGVLSEIEEMKILTQQGPVNANLRGDLAEGQVRLRFTCYMIENE